MIDNKYLHVISVYDGYIFYNRTNGAILKLSYLDYDTIMGLISGVPEQYSSDLCKDVEESGIFSFNKIELKKNNDNFTMTIEMSTMCNLKCTYCYQNGKEQRGEISSETINNIAQYISDVFDEEQQIKKITVGIIGGEPLLHKQKVVNLMDAVSTVCERAGKEVYFHIDTNGTIDFSDVYNARDGIQLSITLSLADDHNKHRPGVGINSFALICSNLHKYKNESNTIAIRYNTNHVNIHDFESFVLFIKSEYPNVSLIDPMFTENHEMNNVEFRNLLNPKSFALWNSTTAIDILIESGYRISGGLQSMLQLCIAYQDYSCKVHADGYISLCDHMEHSELLNISDLCLDLELLRLRFSHIKDYNPLKSDSCKDCEKLIQCMGELFCRDDHCNYNSRYSDDEFLQSFIKYSNTSYKEFFIGMGD